MPIFCKCLKKFLTPHRDSSFGCIGMPAFLNIRLLGLVKDSKKLFYCPSLYKQHDGCRFLQEFERIFILFTNKRLFERFSCLSTVITLEILDFYTFFQKSWKLLSGRLGLSKRAFQVLSIIQWEILSKTSSYFWKFLKFFRPVKIKEKSRYRGVVITLW